MLTGARVAMVLAAVASDWQQTASQSATTLYSLVNNSLAQQNQQHYQLPGPCFENGI
jgi:hypothetical protein